MKKVFPNSKNRIVVLAAVAALIAAAASWTMAKPNDPGRPENPGNTSANQNLQWSKAVLSVSNMSCGGCIDTITKSVAALPGTGDVTVDLTSASAEVMYDAVRLKDPETIARAITDGGYPARIKKLVSSPELGREIAQWSELAKTKIARVGLIEIARKDLDIELEHVRSRYQKIFGDGTFATAQGQQLLQRIHTQIVRGLVDDAIKFQEIERTGYTIQDRSIQSALADYVKEKKTTLELLENDLETNGYPFDYFKKKFGRRETLRRYLEEKVLSDSVDPDDRQQRYSNWLANARSLTEVVYYDKGLEALVRAGSGGGCNSGGCSSGGGAGSCSVSRR